MKRYAKIIATIGPATNSLEQIRALVSAGMDVARLNFSYGSHSEHAATIKYIRQVSDEIGRPVAIMLDLQGPKIRTGLMASDKPVVIKSGDHLTLTTDSVPGSSERISVPHPCLTKDIHPGDRILIDDGRLELKAIAIKNHEVETEVVFGGIIKSHKGINLPGVKLSIPPLTAKDRVDLKFGLQHHIDAVAMSFVSLASDLEVVHEAIDADSDSSIKPPIIAKLERPEAVQNLDGIIEASDGVMVARGDLAVEVSHERVPSIQKSIISAANARLKLVITATQMLDSMVHSPTPTRAEASDVANAVFDGSDALMLSGETAVGQYPIESVRTMERIILDAEAHIAEWGRHDFPQLESTSDDATATTQAARSLAYDRNVRAIAVFTRSGRTARLMSKIRPCVPIFGFTPESATYYQLALLWGMTPFLIPKANSVEQMISLLEETLLSSGRVHAGQQVVLVASLPIGAMGPANLALLHTIRGK